MNSLRFPLDLTFRITTLSNDFTVKDADSQTVAYVRQKMLKLVEEVQVFSNESRSELLYTIKANQWLDFSASYAFTDKNGISLGRIVRKGMASIWKASYEIFNEAQTKTLSVREENPWAKIFDSLLGEIPFVNILTGYFFHPTYVVKDATGTALVRLSKVPSFFGRRFVVDKLAELDKNDEERILLGLMMLILLERQRG